MPKVLGWKIFPSADEPKIHLVDAEDVCRCLIRRLAEKKHGIRRIGEVCTVHMKRLLVEPVRGAD
jgi:hypothetical protein